MSVMVTGASGFVGLNLVEALLAAGETVVGLSVTHIAAAYAERLHRLPGCLHEVIADVRARATVEQAMQQHGVTRVAHFAAITSSAERERSSADEIVGVNLTGLASVAVAAARVGVKRFVHAGSIAVFGGEPADGALMDEDTPHAPKNLYGLTKSAAEPLLSRLAEVHGLDCVTGRLGRVFGPYEHDTGVRDTLSQIHQATAHALAGRAVRFARPCVKNWNFAPDLATRLQTLLFAERPQHRVYNLGASHAWSLADWCERLAERLPGFRYHVGDSAPEAAAAIDLGGARDSGLLSWQRFDAEFQPPRDTGLDTAFDLTMRALSVPAPT